MADAHQQRNSEAQLEALLSVLLDEEGSAEALSAAQGVSPDLLELSETARLLRSASEWAPLPEGRNAVRRALVATAQQSRFGRVRPLAHWWTGWRVLAPAMAAALIVAFGLGAAVLDGLAPPGSPLYGVRLEMDAVRVAFVPTPIGKAELLVRAAHVRIAEIDEMVASGNTRGMAQAAAALDTEAAWLRAITAKLTPAERQRLEDAIEH